MKYLIGFIIWLIAVAIYHFIVPTISNYTVNQCYEHYGDNERWQKDKVVYKVLEIGEKHYRVCLCNDYSCNSNVDFTWTFSNFEHYFSEKTKCPGE